MLKVTPEQLEQKFQELPKTIQDILNSDEIGLQVAQVGKKHNLHIDQIDLLSQIITFVALDFIDEKDFQNTIETELDIEREAAYTLAQDINELVFTPIRKSVLLSEIEDTDIEKTSIPTPKSVPTATPVPTPTAPTSTPTQIPKPSAQPSIPKPPQPVETSKQIVAQNFVDNKLNDTVHMPVQTYKTDPYREPLE